jgi:Ala-tRNA(Pro) deacylase
MEVQAMAIAAKLQQFLADNGVDYDLVAHERSMTSSRIAEASHVPGDRLAKGVVLKDDEGFLLAVVPASRQVELDAVVEQLARPLDLAGTREVERLFPDCDQGAVPPVGRAYGLDVLVEDSLAAQPEIYFESGDHASLVHVDRDGFGRLMAGARHGRFSRLG